MHWYFGFEAFAALSSSATGWQSNLNLDYCSISSPLERKEICYKYVMKSTRKGEGDAKNVTWFHWPSALLLMEGYANENDSSLSVLLSPCSVLLPGCSSPVASSWWLLDQADLFLYRPGAASFGKTQSRAGCFSTSWLTLLCQPLQLFVLFWWDIKDELDGILNWGWKSKSAVVILSSWCFGSLVANTALPLGTQLSLVIYLPKYFTK